MKTALEPFEPYEPFILDDEMLFDVGGENELGVTMFGEAINKHDCSIDDMHIFDPFCKPKNGGFAFDTVHTGKYACLHVKEEKVPDGEVVLSGTMCNPFVTGLLENQIGFHFITDPATDRQRHYRVKSSGKLQRIGIMHGRPFSLNVPFRLRHHNGLVLITTGECKKANFTDDHTYKGEVWGTGYQAVLRESTLQDVKSVFDALVRLDEETLKQTGAIIGVCLMCNKPLTDAVSIERGVGPSCLKKLQHAFAK